MREQPRGFAAESTLRTFLYSQIFLNLDNSVHSMKLVEKYSTGDFTFLPLAILFV
jgi:hypothetical protein